MKKCPCSNTKVVETRRLDGSVYRRRRCTKCNDTHWTREQPIEAPPPKLHLLASANRSRP